MIHSNVKFICNSTDLYPSYRCPSPNTDRVSTYSPSPPQYRVINTSNAGFLRDVVSVEGGVQLMVALGFREDVDGQLVLPAVSNTKRRNPNPNPNPHSKNVFMQRCDT